MGLDRGTPIELGRSHDAYWFRYNGLLDDVRFYNRQLTLAEIAQIAAGGDDALPASDIGLNVQTQMQNVNATAYLRVPFTVTNPAASRRCGSRSAGTMDSSPTSTARKSPHRMPRRLPAWNSTATGTHSGGIVDTFDYTLPAGLLRAGTEYSRHSGLNVTAADANFLMLPKLDGISAP